MVRTLFPRSGAKYEQSRLGREMNDFCLWVQQTGYSKDNDRAPGRGVRVVSSGRIGLVPS